MVGTTKLKNGQKVVEKSLIMYCNSQKKFTAHRSRDTRDGACMTLKMIAHRRINK